MCIKILYKMFAVYLCLVSVLVQLVSSKNSLLLLNGKMYLNGEYQVEKSDVDNIKDGIVNDYTNGPKLKIIKKLRNEEKIALIEELKQSNDMLSQVEKDKIKRIKKNENNLEELLEIEEQQLKKFADGNKIQQKTINHANLMIEKRQNKITEVKGVEGNSRMMHNHRVAK